MSISASDWAHLAAFVESFIPKRRRPRWLTILAAEPKKWSSLSMDDAFDNVGEAATVTLINIDDVLAGKVSSINPDSQAVMFRLSSSRGVVHGTVADLAGELSLEDAIVSVVAGRVALASHHSGDWALLGRP